MTLKIIDNLEKKIKKNIYSKPQIVKAVFPPGLSNIALAEVKFILENLWFKQKFQSECTILKNEIQIENIHMTAIIELMMRSLCLTDLRLVILESKVFGKKGFEKHCRAIDWNYFVNENMTVKIKVNSVASIAFHETALKNILAEILGEYNCEVVTGENVKATTSIYVNLYKDKLTMSISLAGEALYKRGYRGTLSASAPFREDTAACCIKQAFAFVQNLNEKFSPESVIIPFSGTGTFAFEYLQCHYHFPPVLLGREYALQVMPLFRQETFNFLLKKAEENKPNLLEQSLQIYCIDNSKSANAALAENINNFNKLFPNDCFKNTFLNDDFLEMEVETVFKDTGDIFMSLNPPYGIRLGKNSDTVTLYKNIAKKIKDIAKVTLPKKNHLLGFILCPSEASWSAFCKTLNYFKLETYHLTQGGIDIRVCQFYV